MAEKKSFASCCHAGRQVTDMSSPRYDNAIRFISGKSHYTKDAIMAALLLRDLPEHLHRELKARAAQNRRSMAKEGIVLLELALTVEDRDNRPLPQPFRGAFPISDQWLSQAKHDLQG
jgi:hypothetical protein